MRGPPFGAIPDEDVEHAIAHFGRHHAQTVRRVDRIVDVLGADFREPAAVGANRPDLVGAVAIRIEREFATVRRPGGPAIASRVVGETAQFGAINAADEQVFLLFAEIRVRQNLTYAVHAPFVDRAATLGGLYVSTASPDTTLKLMRAAIVDLQQGMLDPVGLKQLEQQFITEYFLDNETNAAQADFLARSQLYEGDYREADRFVQELLNVTPEAVQRVARKYMKGIRFAYVGDPSKLDPRTIALF